jgi:tetratricopeptide (TPR) repeat protein
MTWFPWPCRLSFSLAGLTLLFELTLRAGGSQAAGAVSVPQTLQEQIANDKQLIHAAEWSGMDPLNMGRLWSRLGAEYEDAGDFTNGEAAYNRALEFLQKAPNATINYAATLDNLSSMYLAKGNFDAAKTCRRRSYAIREKTGDGLEIARGKWLLSEVELAKHNYREAQKDAFEAYHEMVALNDHNVIDRVAVLTVLTHASCMHHQCALAIESGHEAVALALAQLPPDALLLGEARMAVGYAEWKAGVKNNPDEEMREGIRILRKRTTPGHPYLLGAMTQYRNYLKDVHRTVEANEIAEEEKKLKGALPTSCANCTVSVNRLR